MKQMLITQEEINLLDAESIDNLEQKYSKQLDKLTGLKKEKRGEMSKREYKELLLFIFSNS